MQQLLELLKTLDSSKIKTEEALGAILEAQLLIPWSPVLVDKEGNKEEVLKNLWIIDEKKFNALDALSLKKLHDANALTLIYAHLFSLSHVATLMKYHHAYVKDTSLENILTEEIFEEPTFNFDAF